MGDQEVIGAVLAGGRSRRFGSPKACVELAGKPLITHALDRFTDAGLESLIVAKQSSELPAEVTSRHRVLIESESPQHPLLGVLTALQAARGARVLVLGCDMPFVPHKLLIEMSRTGGEVVVPSSGGYLQPLCAVYGPETIGSVGQAVEQGVSATTLINSLNPKVIGDFELQKFGDPSLMFVDVDTADDLVRARDLCGE